MPWYLGDITAGLWAAFDARSVHNFTQTGHALVWQASRPQDLVEGELIVDVPRREDGTRWGDSSTNGMGEAGAHVPFTGDSVTRPPCRLRNCRPPR